MQNPESLAPDCTSYICGGYVSITKCELALASEVSGKITRRYFSVLLERNAAIQHKTDQAGLEVSASRRSEGLLHDTPLSHACAYRAATHASVCRRILSAGAQVKPQNSFLITIQNTSGGDSAPQREADALDGGMHFPGY